MHHSAHVQDLIKENRHLFVYESSLTSWKNCTDWQTESLRGGKKTNDTVFFIIFPPWSLHLVISPTMMLSKDSKRNLVLHHIIKNTLPGSTVLLSTLAPFVTDTYSFLRLIEKCTGHVFHFCLQHSLKTYFALINMKGVMLKMGTEMHVSLHVNCPLVFFGFNENLNVLIMLSKASQYQVSKSK